MAHVNVTLNGRGYRLACGEGDEARVQEMAAYLEARIAQITRGAPAQQEHLLVMISLLLADELNEARSALAAAEARSAQRQSKPARRADAARDGAAAGNDPPAVQPEDLSNGDLKAGAA